MEKDKIVYNHIIEHPEEYRIMYYIKDKDGALVNHHNLNCLVAMGFNLKEYLMENGISKDIFIEKEKIVENDRQFIHFEYLSNELIRDLANKIMKYKIANKI